MAIIELRRRAWRTNRRKAVEARVRRALAPDGQVLHKCRPGGRDYHGYGPYYITDERNCIVSAQHDLDDLAREVNVLREGELIDEE